MNRLPDNDPNLPGTQAHGALFDHDAVKSTMTWAFKSPEALKTVVEGHGEYSVKVFDAQGTQIANKLDTKFAEWQSDHPNATKAEQAAHRQKILEDGMAGNVGELFNARVHDLSKSLHFIVDAGNSRTSMRQTGRTKSTRPSRTRSPGRSSSHSQAAVIGSSEATVPREQCRRQRQVQRGEDRPHRGEAALLESQNLFKDLTANAMMRHGLLGDGSPSCYSSTRVRELCQGITGGLHRRWPKTFRGARCQRPSSSHTTSG